MAASSSAAELAAAALARVEFQSPVPSDIAVSQSVEPFHISKVAQAAGITEDELEPYGSFKGKVRNTTAGLVTHDVWLSSDQLGTP